MPTITTTLNITSGGVYTYTPNSVTVTEADTTLVYALNAKTFEKWFITGLTTTDSKSQVSSPTVAPDGASVSFLNLNSKAEQFNVTVQAQHRSSGQQVLIDPEVINDPQ